MRIYSVPPNTHSVAVGEHTFVADESGHIDVTEHEDWVLDDLRNLAGCKVVKDEGRPPPPPAPAPVVAPAAAAVETDAPMDPDAPPPAPPVDLDAPLTLAKGSLTPPLKAAKGKPAAKPKA